jgi:hypothetical protein
MYQILVGAIVLASLVLLYFRYEPQINRRLPKPDPIAEWRAGRAEWLRLERETMAAWEEACQCPDPEELAREERRLLRMHMYHLFDTRVEYLPPPPPMPEYMPAYSDPAAPYNDYMHAMMPPSAPMPGAYHRQGRGIPPRPNARRAPQ